MDRIFVYGGALPQDTDILNTNRNVLVGLGLLAFDVLGSATLVSGLPCTPTTPPGLSVQIGAGRLYSLQNVDSTAYGSLAVDTTDQIVKQGILSAANAPATLSCPAPGTPGYSVAYLIQAQYADSDTPTAVLPYYNQIAPTSPLSGPNGLGAAQPTQRRGTINLVVKAGTPATTGLQTAAAADTGFVGLYVVTVAYGQTTITSGNITTATGAPFLTETLTQKLSQAVADSRYLPLYNMTLAEQAAFAVSGAAPSSTKFNAGDLRRWGANESATSEASGAFNSMMATAQHGLFEFTAPNNGNQTVYTVNSPVTLSYVGQGQVDFEGFTLRGPMRLVSSTMSSAQALITVTSDAEGQQLTRTVLDDVIHWGQGLVGRQPAMHQVTNAYFSAIDKCVSFSLGPLARWSNIGWGTISNSACYGNAGSSNSDTGAGVSLTHCNVVVSNTQVFQHAYGFDSFGTNNVSEDGATVLNGVTANGNWINQIRFRGLYTPQANNFIIEQTEAPGAALFYLESSNFYTISNGFFGPANESYSLQFSYNPATDNSANAWGCTSHIIVQNAMWLDHQYFNVMTGLIFAYPIAANPDGSSAQLHITNGDYNLYNGLMFRGGSANSYSFRQDASTGQTIINGGRCESSIKIDGSTASRTGGNVIAPNYLLGGLVTDDAIQGQLRIDEAASYWDASNNRWVQSSSAGPAASNGQLNYVLPFLAASGNIAPLQSATFSVTALISAAAGLTNGLEAEFMVIGGTNGSTSMTKFLCLQSFDHTKLATLADVGGVGSLSASPSGTNIVVTNNDGSDSIPYKIYMTTLKGY